MMMAMMAYFIGPVYNEDPSVLKLVATMRKQERIKAAPESGLYNFREPKFLDSEEYITFRRGVQAESIVMIHPSEIIKLPRSSLDEDSRANSMDGASLRRSRYRCV